jgi:hypothetical protein
MAGMSKARNAIGAVDFHRGLAIAATSPALALASLLALVTL